MFPYNSIIWPTYAVGNMTYFNHTEKSKKKNKGGRCCIYAKNG